MLNKSSYYFNAIAITKSKSFFCSKGFSLGFFLSFLLNYKMITFWDDHFANILYLKNERGSER